MKRTREKTVPCCPVSETIDRMRAEVGSCSEEQIARMLDTTVDEIAAWKKTNVIPARALVFGAGLTMVPIEALIAKRPKPTAPMSFQHEVMVDARALALAFRDHAKALLPITLKLNELAFWAYVLPALEEVFANSLLTMVEEQGLELLDAWAGFLNSIQSMTADDVLALLFGLLSVRRPG